jgi:hypothetical protein
MYDPRYSVKVESPSHASFFLTVHIEDDRHESLNIIVAWSDHRSL